MKKVFKVITILLSTMLITTICIVLYFKNSVMIIYNVFNELNTSNESIETLGELINYKATNSMDKGNIKYKNTSSNDVFLDIYKSNISDEPSPVILYIHGGSWIYGDNTIPEGLEPVLNAFNSQGYTIISVSYELLKENTPLENPIIDVKDAIRWVYKYKDIYNFDTNNIGILGISSGAHLGLMAAYSNDNEFIGDEKLKDYPSKVKYIIDIFGPTDLKTLDTSSIEGKYKDTIDTIINTKSNYYKYTPLNYINNSSPSTLVIHSKNDELVPYENAVKLYNSLKSNKVHSKFLTLSEGSHFFSGYKKNEIFALVFEILKFIEVNKQG